MILRDLIIRQKRMNANGTIYGIRADCSDEYFYVGSTCKTAGKRLYNHLQLCKRRRHTAGFAHCVQHYGLERIVVDVLEVVPAVDREQCEYRWIEHFIQVGHPLVNRIRSVRQLEAIKKIFFKPAGEKRLDDIKQIELRTREEFEDGRPLYGIRIYAAWTITQMPDLGLFAADIVASFHRIREMFRLNTGGLALPSLKIRFFGF